jgi:Flp pilus assembly protein TadG
MTRAEDGSITAFVVIFMIAILAVAGLVVDGGYLLAARREAANVAESAARAGAQALDLRAARTESGARLDPVAAAQRAEDYLRVAGYRGTVQVSGDRVRVRVTITRHMTLLGVVGLRDATVAADGEAVAVRAVSAGSG